MRDCEGAGRGCGDGKKGKKMSWGEIIRAYKGRRWEGGDFERFSSRKDMPNLATAIETAALSRRANGKMHPHQQKPFNSRPDDFLHYPREPTFKQSV
jgi:hypothetical protein